jgi:hypothetical protein
MPLSAPPDHAADGKPDPDGREVLLRYIGFVGYAGVS